MPSASPQRKDVYQAKEGEIALKELSAPSPTINVSGKVILADYHANPCSGFQQSSGWTTTHRITNPAARS